MHFHVRQGGRKGVCDLWDRSQGGGTFLGPKSTLANFSLLLVFVATWPIVFFVTFAMTTAPYFLTSAIRGIVVS